jgi:uncharacterized protein (TIGR03437 family)
LALAPALCQAQALPAYTISTIAGNCNTAIANPCPGNYGGDGGPALNAYMFGPSDVILDSSGSIYISDTVNNRIRQLYTANGTTNIQTVAGDGTAGYGGDGTTVTSTPSTVEFYNPGGITFDSNGNLYISDYFNYVIREVNAVTDIISTVAGDNTLGAGYTGDLGPATSAQLSRPSSVAVDSGGNIYIADPDNNVVRVVCANQTPVACHGLPPGDINTMAGNYADGAGFTGDGGPAANALLSDPVAVLLDPAGNLYISDSGNDAIRMVNPSGIITTVAGSPASLNPAGYSGDGGPATQAQLNNPKGIGLDASGNLYIADRVNAVVRMVTPAPNRTIYTIAGNNIRGAGYSGDGGPATNAQLNSPSGVAAYGGNIYIADSQNNVIRMLTPPAQTPQINAGGVVNGASYTAPVVPGSIADVFGTFFLTSTSIDTTLPLETSLQNLSFEFSGVQGAAPLYFASGTQANIQVPWEVSGQSAVTLAATLNGTTGASQAVNVAAFAPAIFTTNSQGTGPGAIQDSSYNLISASNPAIAGTTTILIYCTGLGAVSANQPATGSPASLTELAPTANQATVTIGGVTENASFSGLAPGFVGLYQVNALVPSGVSAGSAVPVTISIGDATSNMVTIAVQ